MKNVTITLPEDVAHWARKKAADENVSVSRFVCNMLEESMRRANRFEDEWREWTKLRRRLTIEASNRLSRHDAHARR